MTVQAQRGFVSIDEGQAHFHVASPAVPGRPLVMLHASPASSRMLIPLITRFGAIRPVWAIDTLGNGDSAAPAVAAPDVAYFADAHLRALSALGIGEFDLYGSHTGGCIACEIAIREPQRVRSLILDGMSLYSDEERLDMLANYAPAITPDQLGSQLNWVWHFVRDNALFWPWYRRDAAHLRDLGLPSADALHDKAVEVLKAVRTYHLSYRAAIAYLKPDRLPLVSVRTLLACARDDMLLPYMDGVGALMPAARKMLTPGIRTPDAAAETVRGMTAFLDGAD